MAQFIVCNLILAAAVTSALAQSPTDSTMFEVASIRPNAANDNRFLFRGGQGLTADGVMLKFLLFMRMTSWPTKSRVDRAG